MARLTFLTVPLLTATTLSLACGGGAPPAEEPKSGASVPEASAPAEPVEAEDTEADEAAEPGDSEEPSDDATDEEGPASDAEDEDSAMGEPGMQAPSGELDPDVAEAVSGGEYALEGYDLD